MSTSHKIFSKGLIDSSNKNVIQKVRYNREHLLSTKTAFELNSYLNFGVFPSFAETYEPKYNKVGDDWKLDNSDVGTPGVRSLFNKAGAVLVGTNAGNADFGVDITNGTTASFWRIGNNIPLMDSPEARIRIRKSSGCSIKELVEDSSKGLMGQETYDYSDFMYCKHLGKVSNNYLITLRRFPLPVDDYISANGDTDEERLGRRSKNSTSIGCMVTWMGVSGNEIQNILKYTYSMPFKIQQADWQDNKADADQNRGMLNSMFSVFDSQYRAQYQAGMAGEAANKFFDHIGIKGLDGPPYRDQANFRDQNKIYGPVDVVKETYMRDDKKGLQFDQKISLVFEYELRSYNGINGKQAMLDLISNILNVTYTTGGFWGGGVRGFGAHQSNIFANLNIFKARGGFTNFVDAFALDLQNLSSKIGTALGNDPAAALGNLLNQVGGMLMSGILNKLGRPHKAMYNSLLSPAPVGLWHVTIGNPKRPILSLGNMIITNVTLEHNGPLGIDDFPTGLKVTVELDRGKPRDIRDIEKMYMQGNDRIYSSMGDKVFDMLKNAELYKAYKRGASSSYTPVTETATVTHPADDKSEPTITVADYDNLKASMMKYFGTDDTYSIYVPAAEQEYGCSKETKPATNTSTNTSTSSSSEPAEEGPIVFGNT
jgi:hypothetical protein